VERPEDFTAEDMAQATKRIYFERVRLRPPPAE